MAKDAEPTTAYQWVKSKAQIGDLLLIGSKDRVSRVIQRASNSRFSHAAVLTEKDEVTEAYDYSLTLNERDEGIYRTSLERFLERTPKLHVIRLLRPPQLNVEKLQKSAVELYRSSPPYPTVGATFLGFIRLLAEPVPPLEEGLFGQHRFGKRLHKKLDAMATAKVGFVGDDIHKLHCTESVIAIYEGAGLAVDVPSPFLGRSADRARRLQEQALIREFGAPPAQPKITEDRRQRTRSFRQVAVRVVLRPDKAGRSIYRMWRERMDLIEIAGPNDFIFPGDLERSSTFALVDEHHVEGRGRTRLPFRRRAANPLR